MEARSLPPLYAFIPDNRGWPSGPACLLDLAAHDGRDSGLGPFLVGPITSERISPQEYIRNSLPEHVLKLVAFFSTDDGKTPNFGLGEFTQSVGINTRDSPRDAVSPFAYFRS